MKTTVMYRTECNYGSKYFYELAKAYRHFHKCVALGNSVELWIMFPATVIREIKKQTTVQELIDSVYFS